jgi:hypothetical protein
MNAIVEPSSSMIQSDSSPKPFFCRLWSLWRADFLSPKDLARRALMLALIYGLVSACGLREFTSILNGTVGSVALGWHLSLFLGLLYIVVYLGFVLLVPTLLIAAGLLILWKKVVK